MTVEIYKGHDFAFKYVNIFKLFFIDVQVYFIHISCFIQNFIVIYFFCAIICFRAIKNKKLVFSLPFFIFKYYKYNIYIFICVFMFINHFLITI